MGSLLQREPGQAASIEVPVPPSPFLSFYKVLVSSACGHQKCSSFWEHSIVCRLQVESEFDMLRLRPGSTGTPYRLFRRLFRDRVQIFEVARVPRPGLLASPSPSFRPWWHPGAVSNLPAVARAAVLRRQVVRRNLGVPIKVQVVRRNLGVPIKVFATGHQ